MSQSLPALSLGEQVGQVILAVWQGDWERLAPLVAQGQVGGVLFPAGATPAAGGLATLLNRLQRLSSYPLLCAADLAGPGLWNPTGPALGAAQMPKFSHRAGRAAGELARAQGIHLLLGPTFDVPRTPARSQGAACALSGNPSLAGTLAAAFVAGCWDSGTAAVGRHFPGRGAAVYDVARRLPILPQSRQTLEKIDLVPYIEAQHAGLAAIMSGHLHVTAVDNLPNRLATHSSFVVEGLLRGTLGFDGLLLSDRLEDPEVAQHYNSGQAAVLAFAAGHDMLTTTEPEAVYRTIYEVVLHGDVPNTRLDEAVRRVWALKERLGLIERRYVEPNAPQTAGVRDLTCALAQASLVAVRQSPELVLGRKACLLTNAVRRSDKSAIDGNLKRLAARYLGAAPFYALDAHPSPEQIDALLAAAGSVDVVLIFLSLPSDEAAGASVEALVAMAQAIKRMGPAVGVVVLGDAQALARFPAADLLLYLPGDGPEYLEAAFAHLLGRAGAPGRLPTPVPGLEQPAGKL